MKKEMWVETLSATAPVILGQAATTRDTGRDDTRSELGVDTRGHAVDFEMGGLIPACSAM